MASVDTAESALLQRLALETPLNLDHLVATCPGHTWNQLFVAVDHLSRCNAITLRRIDRQTYLVTLGPSSAAGRAMTSATSDTSRSIVS